ncbi:hypothetical protein GKZ89_20390 [Bacillus mangrovi]|uniref:Uncharacterized protein n=1 Tax=Metabacillus mangrovi TaxID=1491830 RepID=A0A7X2V782_9BACI|nr:hypothetical protein [Metabacillus mangrovi]MTH55754.1 hypothetical protein [Metabacillus mangrovi]
MNESQISLRLSSLLELSSLLKEREQELQEVQQTFGRSFLKASSHYPDLEGTEISHHAELIKLHLDKLTDTMAHLASISKLAPEQMAETDDHRAEELERITG